MSSRRLKHGFTISGLPQSGKTTLTLKLLEDTPRFVILDLQDDYSGLGSVATSFEEASLLIRERAFEPELKVVLLADDPLHHLGLVEYIWELWTTESVRPVVLVMDEARRWSNLPDRVTDVYPTSRKRIPEPLSRVYTAGLKNGVGTLTIMQFPQQVDTEVRNAADFRIAFRHTGNLTQDMRMSFGGREDELATLETLTPKDTPAKGRHFLTYPPDLDPFKAWRKFVVNPMR